MAYYTGKNLLLLDELPSTNTYAAQLDDPTEGTVVQAWHQSAGRGQKGSTWEVLPGMNLTLSLIYRPSFLPLENVFQMSKIAALGIRSCLATFLPQAEILIKWPNDILLNKKKIAGILLENQLEGKRLKTSVLGMGINVNQASFPKHLSSKATSLKLEFGSAFSLEEVRQSLFDQVEFWYEKLKTENHSIVDRS